MLISFHYRIQLLRLHGSLETRMCFVDSFPIAFISFSTQLNWFLLISVVDNYIKIRKTQLPFLS